MGNYVVVTQGRPVAKAESRAPAISVQLVGALLAISISVVHVADAGGITAFQPPDWMAWGFRFIEAGGVLTGAALLIPWTRVLPRLLPPWPARALLGEWFPAAGWAAALLLAAVPFIGYVLSRGVGVPGDPGDVGNWGDWNGTTSLIVEAALVVLSVSMLLTARRRLD